MATTSRKRKATSSLEESTKKLRLDQPLRSPEEPFLEVDEDDDDEDSYHQDRSNSSEEDEAADTPVTPFSPGPKKFPSQLKTIKCTWEGCTKIYNRPARLASHLRSHTNERPFVCSYDGCEKSYIEEKHLKQHIKGSHTHERSHHCDWEGCTKSFLTATRLRRHKEAHEGHDRFRCTAYPPCNQTFRKHQTLQRHIRSDHLELAPFPCTYIDPVTSEQCNAGFDGGAGLRRHQERVHSIPQFFCSECTVPVSFKPDGTLMNLGFTTNAQLQKHIKREHANCIFCDRKCSSQRELQKHIETQHSGTSLEERKNIPCPYVGCNKSFTKKYNLGVHIRTSHDGQRYICGTFDVSKTSDISPWSGIDACGKDFVSKATLEDHIRTAHLSLSSLVNSKRTKPPSFIDDEDDDDMNIALEPKLKKQKPKKQKRSAIDELLGDSYVANVNRTIPCLVPSCNHMFIRDYDLQQHIRNKHRNSTLGINEQAANDFDANFAFLEVEMGDVGLETFDEEDNGREELDAMYEQADLDWEIQQRALEGGPFWVGAGDDEGLGGDQWLRAEMEMRALIGEDGNIDPALGFI